MKIIYKESIIETVERAKLEASHKNKIIKKVIFTMGEWSQLKQEESLITSDLDIIANNGSYTICNIPFEVEK